MCPPLLLRQVFDCSMGHRICRESIAMWAGRSEIDWRMKQALSFSYLKITSKQTGKTKTAGGVHQEVCKRTCGWFRNKLPRPGFLQTCGQFEKCILNRVDMLDKIGLGCVVVSILCSIWGFLQAENRSVGLEEKRPPSLMLYLSFRLRNLSSMWSGIGNIM